MESVIYHFSGRGNSLSVARGMADRLEGCQTMAMAAVEGEEVPLCGGSVGLVFPVIDLGIPAFVRRFIKRLYSTGEAPYVFAVITCGGLPGSSLPSLKKLLKKQGLVLSAGWIMKFGLEKWTEDDWRGRLDEMAGAVRERAGVSIPAVPIGDSLLTGLANPLARLIIPMEDKKFRVDDSCNGCGICAKVCPVKNIVIEEGKPVWQHRCEQCAACFSWCPKQAISGSCLAARTHYTNPRIALRQMTGNIAD